MRKDFYIFRHGETDYNLEHRWQGCGLNGSLNEKGVEQAKNLIPRLAPLNLEVIYSSPLNRAKQTAEIVAEALGVEVKVLDDLREGCFGEAEGMLKADIKQKFPMLYAEWYSPIDDLNVGFPGGETKLQMQQRMLKVLESLQDISCFNVGLASHGSAIRYLLMYFGRPPHKMVNTALYHLVYENGNWQLAKDFDA